MTVYSGNSGVAQVGSTPASITQVTAFSIDEKAQTQSTNAMGGTWETHVTGKLSWEGSIECLSDRSDTNGQVALVIGSSLPFKLYPDGNVTGRLELSGTGTVTGISQGVNQDDANTVTFDVTGNGALTKGVKA
jgi:hypothetical protein